MIRIIEAREFHLPELVKIENACILPPWSEADLRNEIGRSDGLFALALENGSDTAEGGVLGFCILRRAGDEAELYQIAVRKEARNRGVADSLMHSAIRYCRENKIGSIYLEVRKSNEAAIRLYRKHGFKNGGCRKNYYSSPVEDAVVMSLALDLDGS
jgi:ribosomal-protein-alanine N-acetyltransferase